MIVGERWQRIVAGGLIVVFAISLATAFFVPIYLDEIGWRILRARTDLDGGVGISLWPQCTSRFALPVAWYNLPWRSLEGWLYADLSHPLWLRISGFGFLALWLGTALVLVPKALAWPLDRLRLMGLGAAYLGLCLIPLALVINRPEQSLLLAIVLFASLPFVLAADRERPAIVEAALAAGLVLLAGFFFAQHTKAILFTPLVAVTVWFTLKSRALRLAALAPILLLAIANGRHYVDRLACPENAFAAADGRYAGLPLHLLSVDPVRFLKVLYWRLSDAPWYFERLMFNDRIYLNWLPKGNRIGIAEHIANFGFAILLIAVAVLLIVELRRLARDDWRARRLGPRLAVLLSLVAAGLVIMMSQGQKHFYDGTFLAVLAGLGALLGWQPAPARFRGVVAAGLTTLAAVALVSQIAMWTWLWPEVAGRLSGPDYRPSDWSFSAFGYDRTARQIRQTAALCGISPDAGTRNLVVDSITYGTLWRTWRPFLSHYITRHWRGGIEDTVAFLTAKKSEGMVVACTQVPRNMQFLVRRNGDFCCLSSFVQK